MAQLTPEEFTRLYQAVRTVESGGNPDAVSRAGAVGTMQTMPNTLRDPGFRVKPAQDDSAAERERVGIDYLRAMVDKYPTVQEALAAYNWGPGNVNRKGIDSLPAETAAYIPKVMKLAGLAPSFQADVRKSEPTDLAQAAAVPNSPVALPQQPLANAALPASTPVTPPAPAVPTAPVPSMAAQMARMQTLFKPSDNTANIVQTLQPQKSQIDMMFEALKKRNLTV